MSKRLRFCGAALCAVISLAGAAAPARAAIPDFFGTWRSPSPDARGITRIDVRRSGDRIFVRIWGACHPADCDWGEVSGQPYTPDVEAAVWPSTDAVMAQFDTGSEHTMVLLHAGLRGLNYQTFTHFRDGSARSDYHANGLLEH